MGFKKFFKRFIVEPFKRFVVEPIKRLVAPIAPLALWLAAPIVHHVAPILWLAAPFFSGVFGGRKKKKGPQSEPLLSEEGRNPSLPSSIPSEKLCEVSTCPQSLSSSKPQFSPNSTRSPLLSLEIRPVEGGPSSSRTVSSSHSAEDPVHECTR